MTQIHDARQFRRAASVETPMEEWKPEEVDGAHGLLPRPAPRSCVESGELVESEVLAGPDLAKIVTSDGLTAPVVTDGPFQEFKEWVAGYKIVDVESEERAIEIAARISAVPGPGGVALAAADPGAQVMNSSVERGRDGRIPADLSEPVRVSRTCCASSRRRSSACSPAGIGDFDAAEDAVQEALLAAAVHWPRDGIPENAARLADPDRRAAADRPVAERAVTPGTGDASLARQEEPTSEVSDRDDTLAVLFMCCHPALTPASAIALTLRAVGGLTTAEIANAFLVDEATMAQRISRGEAAHQGVRRAVPRCRHARSSRSGCGACCTSST